MINVTNVSVLNNPSRFFSDFQARPRHPRRAPAARFPADAAARACAPQFEVSFECLAPLSEDIEWKLIYVGSAESDEHDQELDSILVGPMQARPRSLVPQADPPDPLKIPSHDLLGVTDNFFFVCRAPGVLFRRAGYYVNNEYDAPELNESPPEPPLHDRLVRTILAEKPRVTRYQIDWQMPPSLPPSLPNENVPPSLPQPAECGVSSGEMMQQVENMQPQPEPMTH
ncbi:hypothetical protein EMIHUDRAFT_67088 [Emiliania huxleyi CCMP1516]|uniref:Anti-silencing factor n=2 Tax=Emiliania huxleyi TaxID=2903 RepID=A0A0D3IM89_EMIH1|nr:hypothetical protein EMIHUDRAFT_67088 [Emiliania huxleyi CCMP1516]EOD12374.1 hypothetical protein EMIHUDRAFT_67088 [Emiliania huxleyi CCMP1516]|eukprot:XP_005764803.1 hypothetical protein EMIHUDRAFT_67088 [Emiliania huxleyi CCMP1516]